LSATTRPPLVLTHREILLVFAGLAGGMLLSALNITMVATALPAMVGDLGGLAQLSWVITAYMLTATVAVPVFGKLSDVYGRKLLFQLAIATFVLGSLLGGLAQTMGQLIASRGAQGIGGGALMTLAHTAIADAVSPRQRGRYLGYTGSVFAVSSIAGPLLGGLFVDHLSWRWVFLINVPLGLAAMGLTARHLPDTKRSLRAPRIDYLGTVLITVGIIALLLVMVWGGVTYPWTSLVIGGLMATAFAALALFVAVERHAPEPVMPIELFADRTFTIGSVLNFIVGSTLFTAIVFVPLFLQAVTGTSATYSGLVLLPLMLGFVASSTFCGRMISRYGRYKLFPIVGTGLSAVGFALLGSMNTETGPLETSAYMAVLGIAMGMIHQVIVLAVQNAVPRRHLGVATSAMQLFRMIGSTFGVAAFGALLSARLTASLAGLSSPVNGGVDSRSLVSRPDKIDSLPASLQNMVHTHLAEAISQVYLLAVPLAIIACVVATLLRERPLLDRLG
jgi:EmrB/QacA subfamily drug resistance transporter